MARATELVFAITELLVNIFLSIDGTSNVEVAKILFQLQRVSKAFTSTISNPPQLKYHMGPDYKPRSCPGTTTARQLLSIFLLDTSSPYPPVHYYVDVSGVLNLVYELNNNTTFRQQVSAFIGSGERKHTSGQQS